MNPPLWNALLVLALTQVASAAFRFGPQVEERASAQRSPSATTTTTTAAPVIVEAQPSAGFHHAYLLVLPPALAVNAPVIVALPTPPTSEDPADFLAAAQRMAANAAPFLSQLGSPILVPVLPRPPVRTAEGVINLYLPALTREALLTDEPALARIDRQVLEMVDDARRRITQEHHVAVRKKGVFVGFSAGGHFATRMAVLHPRRVLAVWAGGTGGHPIVPATELGGRALTYPVGVADLPEVAGQPFDAEAFADVSMLIVQGGADMNTALPAGDGPSDSYSPDQAKLVYELFGRTASERLGKVKALYAAAGSQAEFRTYPDVEHRISPEMARDIVRFIREQAARDGKSGD